MRTERGKGYFVTLSEDDIVDYLLLLSGDKVKENDQLIVNTMEWDISSRTLTVDIDILRRYDS